jgi:exodeoxyribonuclease-3
VYTRPSSSSLEPISLPGFLLRIITLNVNGIRSAERRGLARWLARAEPWDVVCLQEIKATHDDIPRSMRAPRRAHAAFVPADRKGYAGVAVYSKLPARFAAGFGVAEFDAEGRYVEAHFKGLTIISLYLPSGSAGPHRQASKFRFLDAFLPHLVTLRKCGREIILCGDWNIAHQQIDLKNWRSNQKNSGFLPEERAWLTHVFAKLGFVDVFRRVDPRPEQYTWWSNRGAAWAKNVGWRIDYQIATPGIAAKAHAVAIYKNRRFSDHAPLIIDYDHSLSA